MIGQAVILLVSSYTFGFTKVPFDLESEYPVVWFTNEKGQGEKYLISLSATRNAIFYDEPNGEEGGVRKTLKIGITTFALEFTARDRFVSDRTLKGVIGLDFFKSNPIGFDFEKQILYIWPGQVTVTDVQKWAQSLQSWSYLGRSNYTLKPIPFAKKMAPTSAGIEVQIAGKSLLALLASARSGNAIQDLSNYPDAPKLTVGMSDTIILSDVSVADRKIGMMEAEVGRQLNAPGLPASIDMRLALGSINSRLTVVDYPSQRIFVEDLPKHASNSLFLSRALGFPVYIEAGKVKLGTLRNRASPARRFEGSIVEFVGDVPTSAVLEALEKNNNASIAKLTEFLNSASKATRVSFRHQGGKSDVPVSDLSEN